MHCSIRLLRFIVLVASLAALVIHPADAQSVTPLDDPSQWSLFYSEGTGSLTPTAGVMTYTTTSTAASFAAQANQTLALPYASDWSLQTYAHLGNVSLPAYSNFVDLELVLSPLGSTPGSTRVAYLYEFGNWHAGTTREVYPEIYLADNELSSGLDQEIVFNTTVGLRLDYSAATHLVSFFFDHDGPGTTYTWQLNYPLPGTFSLTDGASDFGLTNADAFSIALVVASSGVLVNAGDVYFSNLVVTGATAVPEPASVALLAGLATLAAALHRRRLRAG